MNHLPLPELNALLSAMLAALPAALAIIAGTLLVKFVLHRGLDLLADRTRLSREDIEPARKVVNWLLTGLAIILLLGIFGFNLGGLWTMLSTILALIAIGFVAVWSVLSNVSCTFIILIFRPFSVGDEVEFVGEQVKGRVADLNFLYTTLRTDDGALIQIPNNMFFQKSLRRRPGEGKRSLAEQLRQQDNPA